MARVTHDAIGMTRAQRRRLERLAERVDPVAEQRTRRLAECVHRLGAPAVLHAMREIADGADLDATLTRYAALPVDFVRDLGGDRFPKPLHVISGGRH